MSEITEWTSLKEKGGVLVRRYGVLLIIGMVGVGCVGYGVYMAIRPESPVVEIVKSEVLGESEGGEIMVDVAGAVEKPGLYTLSKGSRIGDALVVAGGLAGVADRGWVSRYLNLASKIEDGAKIYIPAQVEGKESGKEEVVAKSGRVNINTASIGELDSLWGIGEARAKMIIENRPYSTLEELMSKAGLSESVYAKIKDEISVY